MNVKLETQKTAGIHQLREASKDYLTVKERVGTETKTGSYQKRFLLFFHRTEYYTYQENYSYCIAADAIENLKKYSLEASNQVEDVFKESLNIKEIKRKLLNVVMNNFDMSSEKYDSSLFRLIVEDTINKIEFPIFNIDISDAMNGIAGKFNGEITSAGQKNELSTAVSNAISRIGNELCDRLEKTIKDYKNNLTDISNKAQENLLTNMTKEFETLLAQCEDKDKEISGYKEYIKILSEKFNAMK